MQLDRLCCNLTVTRMGIGLGKLSERGLSLPGRWMITVHPDRCLELTFEHFWETTHHQSQEGFLEAKFHGWIRENNCWALIEQEVPITVLSYCIHTAMAIYQDIGSLWPSVSDFFSRGSWKHDSGTNCHLENWLPNLQRYVWRCVCSIATEGATRRQAVKNDSSDGLPVASVDTFNECLHVLKTCRPKWLVLEYVETMQSWHGHVSWHAKAANQRAVDLILILQWLKDQKTMKRELTWTDHSRGEEWWILRYIMTCLVNHEVSGVLVCMLALITRVVGGLVAIFFFPII